MAEMKVIALMGDSHTWGEGVGAEYGFDPPVVCADKRMNSFAYPNYANLLRKAVNLRTGSTAREIIRDELAALCGGREGDYGILSPDKPVSVRSPFGLCRLFLFGRPEPAAVTVSLDGRTARTLTVRSDDPSPSAAVCLVTLRAPSGIHTLTLTASAPVRLHRIELYDGPYAVVNCGIGSCPIGRYVDTFFRDYIAALEPYAVVLEGNTINDWLTGEPLSAYADDLTRAVAAVRALTPRIMAHSVFPIAGARTWGAADVPYESYVSAMKDTLEKLGVRFADTHAAFLDELSRVPEARRNQFLYHDPWHPNGTGHAIYAREILPELCALIGLPVR
ncbi:MAG: SGNH/GDSL hydrolase family protein [Clostridia bacterium]|nr:SGNH/GDSL hydrolase family protein [Clostridia bacterium]